MVALLWEAIVPVLLAYIFLFGGDWGYQQVWKGTEVPPALPVISLASFFDTDSQTQNSTAQRETAAAVNAACRSMGFFYVSDHGVSEALQARLERVSAQFFELSVAEKMTIAMAHGGRAWRGYFPPEGEITSGVPDLKEGIYFGTDLPQEHLAVVQKLLLHGANIYPDTPLGAELREVVDEYMTAVVSLGHVLVHVLSLSLNLDAEYLTDHYLYDPTVLFRIFNYPPYAHNNSSTETETGKDRWGVGEHTDYGVLTLLKQDLHGGLQVKTVQDQWINAPPIPNTFVVNIGDMLERMTKGYYVSTPHRVKAHTEPYMRQSFPLFFDPAFDAAITAIPLDETTLPPRLHAARAARWDGNNALTQDNTEPYGQYLGTKISKVFPELFQEQTTN
jgi:isopenicillin N synthase-like dioxygenase